MSTIPLSEEIKTIIYDLRAAQEYEKRLKKQIEHLKQKLYNAMKENEIVVDEDGCEIVTWKQSDDIKRFNHKRFEQDNPALYAMYVELSPGSRRLLIK